MPVWLLITALVAPVPQDSVNAFWNRLTELEQPAAVQALVAERSPGSVEQSLGLVRIYQISQDDKDGKAAERLLKKQLDDDEADPWLQFGLGEVLAIRNPRKFPLRASKYLLQALRLDSMHVPAAAALGRLALMSREEELLVEARLAGERIVRHNANSELLNTLAAIAREQRDVASQRDNAAAALKANPASAAARYQLGLGQMLEPSTRKAGYENYLAAADLRDPALLKQIRQELSIIGNADELPDFEKGELSPGKQLAKFWNVRAIRDGRAPVERAAEHYRRLAHARDKFQSKWGTTTADYAVTWNDDNTRLGYDDRGRIYIRYGEPTEIIRAMDNRNFGERRERASDSEKGPIMSNSGARPTDFFETWIYDMPLRERVHFHFQLPMQAGRGFVLSLIPGCGNWLNSHISLSGQYQLLATKCGSGSAPEWSVLATLRDMNEVYKESVGEALKTDAFVPNYKKELVSDAELYSFRGRDGKREYSLVAAAAAERFNLRVVVADTTMDFVSQLDTLVSVRLGAGQFASVVHNFSLDKVHAPFFRMHLSDPANETVGAAYGGSVPTYLMKGFDISDVVLSDTASGGNLRRGDIAIRPLPARITSNGAFKAYYEIYDLPTGTEYETILRFEPVEGAVKAALRKLRNEEAVSLSFKGTITSTDYRQQELRSVQLPLAPGAYRLTITVRDLRSGAEAVKQRTVRIQ